MQSNNQTILKELEALGITGVKDIHYTPSYEELFKMEMDPSLTGYDKGLNSFAGSRRFLYWATAPTRQAIARYHASTKACS